MVFVKCDYQFNTEAQITLINKFVALLIQTNKSITTVHEINKNSLVLVINNNFDIDTNLLYLNILKERHYQTTIFDEILFLCHELKSV